MTTTEVNSPDPIHFYQFHRWLIPLVKQRAEMATPMTSDQIVQRLEPHVFSLRRSHLPFNGLFGSLESSGFTLRKSLLAPRRLVADYAEANDGTRLSLEFAASGWGVLRSLIYLIFWPVAIVSAAFDAADLSLASPIESMWIEGRFFIEQPVFAIIIVIFGLEQMWVFFAHSWRDRCGIAYFGDFLAQTIDARWVTEDETSDQPNVTSTAPAASNSQ